jgi:hypothetical protein
MRGFFPLCHCFVSFWHYGIAGQYMTTAIGGGFLSLNKVTLLAVVITIVFRFNDPETVTPHFKKPLFKIPHTPQVKGKNYTFFFAGF